MADELPLAVAVRLPARKQFAALTPGTPSMRENSANLYDLLITQHDVSAVAAKIGVRSSP